MTTQLEPPDPARWLDGIRYHVPSRTDPHTTYLCELTHFNGNGECVCTDFDTRFRPLLSRMVKPEQALAEGLVTQRKYQRPDQVLMCWHLVEAHWQFEKEVLQAIVVRQRQEKVR